MRHHSRPPQIATKLRFALALLSLCLITGLVYIPGLSGDFLFDDFANLPALGAYGPIVDLPSVLRYITSGIADPTGRPVSLLSFLIDSNSWPASPYPFKRTNLFVHLANGLLLAFVLRQLGISMKLNATHAYQAALLGAAFWWLHPLWVSSVTYVIQRQALLSTTFVLSGVWFWIQGWNAFSIGRSRKGWIFCVISIAGCGLLAGLSKSNGFLLPILLLSLRCTVLQGNSASASCSKSSRWATTLLLALPAVAVLISLIGLTFFEGTTNHERPWTTGQRLITQPRVLMDYFRLLLVPQVHSPGLFIDNFQASRTLFSPWTTLPAFFVISGLVALGFLARRRYPAFALALLFFFAGHLLESSVVPLELYFEHRNYLPALFLGWPIALWVTSPGRPVYYKLLFALGLVVLAFTTYIRASLWGDPAQLAMSWAKQQPDSPRSQAMAAQYETERGTPELAVQRLQPLVRSHPEETQYALTLFDAECALGALKHPTLQSAAVAIAAQGVEQDMVHKWLRNALDGSKSCTSLTAKNLDELVAAAHRHPDINVQSANRLAQLDGLLALKKKQCTNAVREFNRGLGYWRNAQQVIGQTGLLATHCGPGYALAHLDYYRQRPVSADSPSSQGMQRLHQRILLWQGYWNNELDALERTLRHEQQTRDIESRD